MINETAHKVTSDHLKRRAYLYIRQSTLRQVFENTESTKRQYALRERAIALGWQTERINVIDCDLGQSGATSENREGFKRLVSEVGLGNAGIVIGLEVSRLARRSSDWHRLLEICALTNTLILDEDGIYNPSHFNDRLLLGLKGTMSEAELHILKARLIGGIFTKAKRGELKVPVPIGFLYNSSEKVIMDPDKQIRDSIYLFFETFRKVGSATGTIKYFRKNGLKFPKRLRTGPNKGDVVWSEMIHSRALRMLHNPRYAGAFFFGRTKQHKLADGTMKYEKLPQEQWHSLLKNAHDGYISWEEYEENIRQLHKNAQANGAERRSPPREGPALLQGLVMCGVCGKQMTIRYHTRYGKNIPDYMCQRDCIEHGGKRPCQSINGEGVDETIVKLLIESVSPLALEVALKIQDELKTRANEADRLRKQQVERCRYEADLSRRRYMQIDPDNRLVADSLEAEWNDKLRVLNEAQKEYEQQRKADQTILNSTQKTQILALATDFPRLWNDPNTSYREKKRMVKLLIEDVTLIKNTEIMIHVRFKGGVTKSLNIPSKLESYKFRKPSNEVLSQIDELLNKHTDSEIADILNKAGKTTGMGKVFNSVLVSNIRRRHGLKSLYTRLREKKLLTQNDISSKLKISKNVLKPLANKDIIKAYRYNDSNLKLYEWPNAEKFIKDLLEKSKQGKSKESIKLLVERIKEVQYEA